MPRAWAASTSALKSALVPKCGSTCGEVGDPVAVIAGAFLARRALHRLVLEHRRQPDGGRAEALDVIEALGQPLEVAAVIEALVRRVEAGGQPVAGQPAAIVRRIAILEPVGQQEIDDLVLAAAARDSRAGEAAAARARAAAGSCWDQLALHRRELARRTRRGRAFARHCLRRCARSSPSRNSRSRASGTCRRSADSSRG